MTGPHMRVPWKPADPKRILVHSTLSEMKGGEEASSRQSGAWRDKYNRAKYQYSVGDAFDIVDRFINSDALDLLVDAVIGLRAPPIIVIPQPGFHDDDPCDPVTSFPTNALPFALSQRIGEELEAELDTDIIQVSRPGRTTLRKFPRFIWQPHFEGAVRPDRAYIVVDDVCTNGGTLAMLRSHIVRGGGTVIAATTLAHKSGRHQSFQIEQGTRNVLMSIYGFRLAELWEQEVGHVIECLTEGEGTGLADWSRETVPRRNQTVALQRLRNRFDKARRTAG